MWQEQGAMCLSVPFTWLLHEARGICLAHPTKRIVVGGPAIRLMPKYLADLPNVEMETIQPSKPPLQRANPDASRTTLGCPNRCPFCGVNTIEGPYRELKDWPPLPLLCDSNFLACSDTHFDYTIDRLKQAKLRYVDFNQALWAKGLTKHRAGRLAELPIRPRFAWDRPEEEDDVFRAIELMVKAGIPKSRHMAVLCLVGYNETPQDALYRMETLKSRGLLGFAMRYQPLDTLKINEYCPPQWDPQELKDFCRYWNRQSWLGGITYEEYRARQYDKRQLSMDLNQ